MKVGAGRSVQGAAKQWTEGGCREGVRLQMGGAGAHPTPRSWAGSLHAASPPHALHPS